MNIIIIIKGIFLFKCHFKKKSVSKFFGHFVFINII